MSTYISSAWRVPFTGGEALHNPHIIDVTKFILWGMQSLVVVFCSFLLLVASRSFANEEYEKGVTAFICAIIVGMAPFISNVFLY